MNEVLALGMVFAIMIRCIGLLISLEFYSSLKDKKFLRLVYGWLFWILAALSNLLSLYVNNSWNLEILLLLNIIFSSLGDFLILMGIITYFREIPDQIFLGLILFFISGPIIAYFLEFYLIMLSIISITRFIITGIFTALPFIERRNFLKIISKKSFLWLIILIVSIYSYTLLYFSLIFQGKIYGGIIKSTGIELIVYIFLLNLITFMLVILTIHLEYDIANYIKFKLKDKYSHNLGNDLHVIMGSIDLLSLDMEDNEFLRKINDLIKKKCKESAEIIKEIRRL
ncbi:MAG: hypothetical protein ACTSR8_17275 [Promethearchaeota archaeon]